MNEVYEEARKSLLHGSALVVCEIIRSEGSSPRKSGARMTLDEKGRFNGTIGGGDLERYCIEKCREVLSSRYGYEREFFLDSSKNDDVSMICGGNVTVRFTYVPCDIDSKELKALFGINGSEPIVYIFGGGHVGRELCSLLEHVEFRVVVLDDRPEFASGEMHPKAEKTILCDYSDISKSVTIRKEDYVCIMTHGHQGDSEVLLQTCRINPCYIGCIGSRRKVAKTQEYLRENGIGEEVIASIHSPIGIELYGDTPQEIAVSVAAELIRHRAILAGNAR